MPDKDLIMAKVSIIQRCLQRIRKTTNFDPSSLDDIDKQDIFVLNLQRAIQATIDLTTHIVAAEGLGIPETIRENFSLLEKSRIIPSPIAVKMGAMVGFRNIAVHNYQTLNLDILKSILKDHLKDIEEFYTAIVLHFHLSPDAESTK